MLQGLAVVFYTSLLLAPATTNPSPPAGSPLVTTVAGPATIKRTVEEVRVSFSVQDGPQLLKSASAADFTVWDNAHVIPTFTAFAATADLPLRIGLLIDRSDSVNKEFTAEQQAAQKFLRTVLRPKSDSLFLLEFTHKLNFYEAKAGEVDSVSDEIKSVQSGGQTALYDALYAAAKFHPMTSSEVQPVRRAIILFSDGEDTCSMHGVEDAIEAAQQGDVIVYAITVHKGGAETRGNAVLSELAAATGGRAFILSSLKGLDQVFTQIEDELRSQYEVAFRLPVPEQCGYHKLVIEAHDPKLIVHARQAYFACK